MDCFVVLALIAAAAGLSVVLRTQSDRDAPGFDASGEIPPVPGGCDEHCNFVDPAEWEAWWLERTLTRRNG